MRLAVSGIQQSDRSVSWCNFFSVIEDMRCRRDLQADLVQYERSVSMLRCIVSLFPLDLQNFVISVVFGRRIELSG